MPGDIDGTHGSGMDDRLRQRWLPVLAVLLVGLVLVAAGWAAAGGGGLSGGEITLPPPTPEPLPTAGTAAPASEPPATGEPAAFARAEPPGWLSGALTALVFGVFLAVVAVLLYVAGRWFLLERVARREIVAQPASQPADAAAEEVRDAVRAGLAELDAGGDTRRAVIACWLRLERAAAAAGTARLAPDTPADLVRRLLSAHRVSDRALARLAGAYRLARYAPAEVGDELLATARQALAEIDAQLAAGPAKPERGAGMSEDRSLRGPGTSARSERSEPRSREWRGPQSMPAGPG